MAEALYPQILRGDDPRLVLYELRRQLFMHAERDHDWASLVAYSTVPNNFDDQVMTFFERQTKKAIEVCLELADATDDVDEIKSALNAAKEKLELWKSRLPKGDGVKERVRRSECYGIHGSTYKRFGLLMYKKGEKKEVHDYIEKSLASYRRSMELWAMGEAKYHWTATQFLCLSAVLNKSPDRDTFLMARKAAEFDLAKRDKSLKAWAHADLAELEMLAKYHCPEKAAENQEKKVIEHCETMVNLMGEGSFHVNSTRRQFQRYLDHWCKKGEEWQRIAKEAVRALSVGSDES